MSNSISKRRLGFDCFPFDGDILSARWKVLLIILVPQYLLILCRSYRQYIPKLYLRMVDSRKAAYLYLADHVFWDALGELDVIEDKIVFRIMAFLCVFVGRKDNFLVDSLSLNSVHPWYFIIVLSFLE